MSRDCPLKTILVIVGFANTRGVRPTALLQAARLDPSLFSTPDAYLSHAQEDRLWEEAVRLTGDEDFGLHLAEWAVGSPHDHFDVLSYALLSSPTLGEQYLRAGRYFRLIHEGVYLAVEAEGDLARVVHGHHDGRSICRHPMEGMLAMMLLNGQRSIGEVFSPRKVCFAHPRPPSVREHERVFQAPVHFGCPRNELVMDRDLLDRPQRRAEARLAALLDRQLDKSLGEIPERHHFLDEVRQAIQAELPDREPTVALVSARLRMSPRSLQRQLQVEGTRFADVLSALRRDMACRYLQDARISIGEVSFLLGFQDVTAFHRAFKRWTGRTPAEHRHEAAQAQRASRRAAMEP